MNEEAKVRATSIVNKLYLSLSVIILLVTIVVSIGEISDEYEKTKYFETAHSELEKAVRYNLSAPGKSLEESRVQFANDALVKSVVMEVKPDSKFTLKEFAVEAACFEYNGIYLGEQSKGCRFRIYNFKPGKTPTIFFKQLLILFGVATALFFFRKWFIWLVAKPRELSN